MSQANVEGTRAAWAALLNDDFETFLAFIDPGVVWHQRVDLPDSTTGYGHAALVTLVERWRGEWEEYEVEIDELVDAGDQVVAVLRIRGTGRASGAPVELRETHVYELRGGRCVEAWEYPSKEEAMQSIGLSEQTQS